MFSEIYKHKNLCSHDVNVFKIVKHKRILINSGKKMRLFMLKVLRILTLLILKKKKISEILSFCSPVGIIIAKK